MLAIRYQRQGRKNQAFFRVVLTESSKPPKSGFLKILGWYNPHSKESKLESEEIVSWLDKGAQASNSVSRLLNANGITHKNATFVPKQPKAKKSAEEEEKKAPAKQEEDVEASEEVPTEEVDSSESSESEAPEETTMTPAPETAPEENTEAQEEAETEEETK